MNDRGRSYLDTLSKLIPGVVYRPEPHRHIVFAPCRDCDGVLVEGMSSAGIVQPEQVARRMRERGWTIGRNASKHQCPKHRKEPEMPPANTAAVAPSPDARAARRAAMEWLGESFDLTTGRYQPGVSDATIAKEVGMAETAVAGLREEFFGPLREPSEIETIRAQLAMLEDQASTLIGNAQRLHADIMAEVKELGRKLDGLARSNGWKP